MRYSPCCRLAGLCLAGVLIVSLAACGAGSASGGEPVPDPVPAPPRRVTPVVARAPAHDPLTAYYELPEGTVRLTGVVVAMTRQRYQQFRLDARGPWKSSLLEGRDFPMPLRLLAEPDVYHSDLDAGGTYALTMPPGDYVLCLADLSEVQKPPSSEKILWVDRMFETVVTDEALQTIIPILDRATGELVVHH